MGGLIVDDRCYFCGTEIADQAEGFMVHVHEHRQCRELWDVWTEFLQEDWGGD